jgi:mannosyl-oligosaccharide glucosidase
MLGSIAYMYGDRMIFDGDKVILEKPSSLFTGIPDRPNHGRGFMWDEGFHNHLISAWNMNLTEQIISSWFATTDQSTGWICREQMLGKEIRSGAPPTSWP